MEKSAIVIPVRMGSTRFPGKPLAKILGLPMLEWVINHSVQAIGHERTFVATCDTEIMDLADSLGVRSLLTSNQHERATDRTAEAVDILEAEGWDFENILLLQGDEPTIPPEMLKLAIETMFQNPTISILNLVGPIVSEKEWLDPNCIKILSSRESEAIYLSRLPLPHGGIIGDSQVQKQVCAIGFRREDLRKFSLLDPTPLEISESIDMLRWIENGGVVTLKNIESRTHPVDHPHDIQTVESILSAAANPEGIQ